MKENIRIKHNVFIKEEIDGVWLTVASAHNLITQMELVANLLIGVGTAITHTGVGTDSTPPNTSQTDLLSPLLRKAFSASSVVGSKTIVEAIFNPGEATGSWEEAGVFNASSGGTMFDRALLPYVKTASKRTKVVFEFDFQEA